MSAGPRKGGLLSGMLLNILKWAAIGIGAVIIVVTTTVITVRIVSKGNSRQGLAALSPNTRPSSRRSRRTTTSSRSAARPRTTPRDFPSSSEPRLRPEKDKEVSAEIGGRKRRDPGPHPEGHLSEDRGGPCRPPIYDEIQAELMQLINTS